MRPTWILLQLVNLLLGGASAYVFYFVPGVWMDQAQLYFCLAGVAAALLTVLFAGGALVAGGDGLAAVHGLLGLAFLGAQGFWLWRFGQHAGLIHFVRRAFNL